MPPSSPSRWRLLATLLAAAALFAIAVRLAWLGDDAYITLRAVENWVRGNGLRWNVDDRVQTYTHPLWMLLLAAGRALSGEVYFTTLSVSLLLSTAAVAWLCWRARTVPAIAATAVLLVSARAFGDYMTSGLETPLTFVLLIAFAAVVLGEAPDASPAVRFTRAVLLASLAAVNRMDLALLCAPAVLATLRGVPWRAVALRGLAAAAPFVAWVLFAWIYYGSPLPVTAHAKAFGLGLDPGDVARQGLRYLWHTLVHDGALLAAVAVGAPALLFGRRTRWLALGCLLYVAYVVEVGGDFMQGRFLLPPFVVVVACAGGFLSRHRTAAVVAVAAVALLGVGGLPAWLRAPADDTPLSQATIDAQHGIVDERRMYYAGLGLVSPARAIPRFGALEQIAFPEGRDRRWWLLNGAVGSAGFGAGANGHIVDPLLCDPLVARLPAADPAHWRIGHVLRRFPEGYWETLASGENRIVHPGLHRYYGALRTLTSAPVFDGERLATLWRMARGGYEQDLRAYVAEWYYAPPRFDVAARELPPELPLGCYWFDEPRVRVVYDGGLAVRFDAPVTARSLRVQTMGLCAFRFRFVADGVLAGEARGAPLPPPAGLTPLRAVAGLRAEGVLVPDGVTAFDTLWIDWELVPDSDKATGPPGIGAIVIGG